MEGSDWLDVAGVRRATGASRSTVWRWFAQGLRRQRIGCRWKVRREWLDEFQAALDGVPTDVDKAAAEADQRALAERLAGGRHVRA